MSLFYKCPTVVFKKQNKKRSICLNGIERDLRVSLIPFGLGKTVTYTANSTAFTRYNTRTSSITLTGCHECLVVMGVQTTQVCLSARYVYATFLNTFFFCSLGLCPYMKNVKVPFFFFLNYETRQTKFAPK